MPLDAEVYFADNEDSTKFFSGFEIIDGPRDPDTFVPSSIIYPVGEPGELYTYDSESIEERDSGVDGGLQIVEP